ncbi:MAG: hypothetical protein AAGE92_02900, partial [Cyanobacteria bacterium P01_G01_bin.4]
LKTPQLCLRQELEGLFQYLFFTKYNFILTRQYHCPSESGRSFYYLYPTSCDARPSRQILLAGALEAYPQ